MEDVSKRDNVTLADSVSVSDAPIGHASLTEVTAAQEQAIQESQAEAWEEAAVLPPPTAPSGPSPERPRPAAPSTTDAPAASSTTEAPPTASEGSLAQNVSRLIGSAVGRRAQSADNATRPRPTTPRRANLRG